MRQGVLITQQTKSKSLFELIKESAIVTLLIISALSSQHVRACAAGDGAICSKNRKIVPYHGTDPNTRNGARLRSPSPFMAPVCILFEAFHGHRVYVENSLYSLVCWQPVFSLRVTQAPGLRRVLSHRERKRVVWHREKHRLPEQSMYSSAGKLLP